MSINFDNIPYNNSHVIQTTKSTIKTAKCLLNSDDKYFVAVNKRGRLSAIGGKGERSDRSPWYRLLRELKEETGVTRVTRVNGPIYERETNYFHVVATQLTQRQPEDVTIVALSLAELNKLPDKEKCYTAKRVEALFIPFSFFHTVFITTYVGPTVCKTNIRNEK